MNIDRRLLEAQLSELSNCYPGSYYSDGCVTVPFPSHNTSFSLFLSTDYPWTPPLIYITGAVPPQLQPLLSDNLSLKFPDPGQWSGSITLTILMRQLEQLIRSTSTFNLEAAKKRVDELKAQIHALQQTCSNKQGGVALLQSVAGELESRYAQEKQERARVEAEAYRLEYEKNAAAVAELRSRLNALAQQGEYLVHAYRTGGMDAAAFQRDYTSTRHRYHLVQALLSTLTH